MTKLQYTNKLQITITKNGKLTKIGNWISGLGIYLEFANINFKYAGLAFIVLIVAALCIAPGMSYAFKQADLDRLMTTKQCQWCDLRNADLAGAQLSGAQIANTNLAGADLSGADLTDANLASTVMSGVNLQKADLSGAYMNGTRLQRANLSGANLSKARLNNANLLDANLSDTNFSGVSLSGTTWNDGRKCDDDSMEECIRAVSPANRGSVGGGIPF